MKENCLLLVLLLMSVQFAFSQNTVSGTVRDLSTNEPLVGANIVIKGTSGGTITDVEGKYSLSANGDAILVFSYIGYITEEIAVNGRSTIEVLLSPDIAQLQEVVVVGYGTQKKSHLTGAISKVDNLNIDEVPVSRIDQALSGRIAGLAIQNVTSESGVAPQIRVRGMGSISASNEPLIVVDGYPVPDGLAMVDMNNVESVEVLKDASSAAIYGSRGANGVIIITTKNGQVAKPKYKFSAYTGWKDPIKLYPMMSSIAYTDYRMYEHMVRTESAEPTFTSLGNQDRAFRLVAEGGGDTNWQEQGLRNAIIKNYNLSVSSGVKGMKYYFSGSYSSDEGIMKKSDYEKMSMQAKVDADLSSKFKISFNLVPTYSRRQRPSNNYTDFVRTYSWLPPRHNAYTSELTGYPIGTYAHGRHFQNRSFTNPETGTPFTVNVWSTANNNPLSILERSSNFRDEYRLLGNTTLAFEPIKNLEFRTTNGFYMNYYENEQYSEVNSNRDGVPNVGIYGNRKYIDLLSENIINYKKDVADHSIDALLGYTVQKTTISNAGIEASNFPTDYIHTLNAGTVLSLENTGTTKEEITLMSLLSRINYSFRDRYLVSAAIRTDGSSLFGPERKWGWFPSLSLGWRVSEEPFFSMDFVEQLKFRASIGVTGNNDIQNYASQNTIIPTNYQFGLNPSQPTAGLGAANLILGNKAISWEQTQEYNYGFDLSLARDRFGAVVDYYYSITDQLLLRQEINSITGYQQYWNNIGRIRNKGWEVEVYGRPLSSKDFSWRAGINFSANKNRLLELGGEEQTIKQGERNEQYLAKVGHPSIQYYGYKMIGIWASQEELNTNPRSNEDAPGGIRVADVYEDGVIDSKDRTILGNPFPDFQWGFSNEIKYKFLDLNFLFEGVQGVSVFNGDGYYAELRKINEDFVVGRWINEQNPGTKPFERNGRDWLLTDYLIEDGSYWCLRNVSLGFTFSKDVLNKIGVNSARIYLAGQNMLYFMAKDYRGINPEARTTSGSYSDPLIDGYQRGAFPLSRTYTVGLNLNF